jgi:peptidoglycan biosynthesis protein MviN/MurJ (putative lipid II flippase)
LIKFKPLIIGGISCFVITIISTFLEPDYQILMLALALATSYLIPGYLLRYKFKKQGQNV